ncbi:GCD complex subunit gcd7 [Ascosphaera aggregata]|nr:GCD complex subunit gcd7 [Ascosphaera aggregata]
MTPCLRNFLDNLKTTSAENSAEQLISLLKRRQITHPHAIALSTIYLLRTAVTSYRSSSSIRLLDRVSNIGERLCDALPREMIVGNIVRRVLTLIREESEGGRKEGRALHSHTAAANSGLVSSIRGTVQPKLVRTATQDAASEKALVEALEKTSLRGPGVPAQAPPIISMFHVLAEEEMVLTKKKEQHPDNPKTGDLRAEVIDGINEIIDELSQVDDQIAAYAPEHIHSNEVILTYSSSRTVQKFLLKAATKRRFTVIHAESYPNRHLDTHAYATGTPALETQANDTMTPESFQKTLTDHGITVILVPDSAVFALMARVNKVILGTHTVLANGGLLAASGSRIIANAATVHKTPVVVVTGIYKVSPVYPFDPETFVENGDSSKIIGYEEGDLIEKIEVENPLQDYVPPEVIDLYITNV